MIVPPALQPGDKIGLVAPANKIDPSAIEDACRVFSGWDLEVVKGDHLLGSYGTFSGTDQQRTHDLQEMLDNADIKAIVCARGGYGVLRIIDLLDLTYFSSSPKWVIGYSDITALHAAIYKKDIISAHAIMPINFARDQNGVSIESLKNLLFGSPLPISAPADHLNRSGIGRGRLIGGNLALICSQIGTETDLDTNGTILFIEEIGEYLYHFDRMMIQLQRSGKLATLSGLVLGQFTDMKDNDIPFIRDLKEIISEKTYDYNYPVAFNFSIGHELPNFAIPHGCRSKLEVTDNGARLSFELTA